MATLSWTCSLHPDSSATCLAEKKKKGWSYLFLLSLNFSVYRMLWDENTPVLDKMHLAVSLCELDIPYALWNQIVIWILRCHLSVWLFQRIFHKQVLNYFSVCYSITLVQANAEIVFSVVYFHHCDFFSCIFIGLINYMRPEQLILQYLLILFYKNFSWDKLKLFENVFPIPFYSISSA